MGFRTSALALSRGGFQSCGDRVFLPGSIATADSQQRARARRTLAGAQRLSGSRTFEHLLVSVALREAARGRVGLRWLALRLTCCGAIGQQPRRPHLGERPGDDGIYVELPVSAHAAALAGIATVPAALISFRPLIPKKPPRNCEPRQPGIGPTGLTKPLIMRSKAVHLLPSAV
jgi:hypothetical protein